MSEEEDKVAAANKARALVRDTDEAVLPPFLQLLIVRACERAAKDAMTACFGDAVIHKRDHEIWHELFNGKLVRWMVYSIVANVVCIVLVLGSYAAAILLFLK